MAAKEVAKNENGHKLLSDTRGGYKRDTQGLPLARGWVCRAVPSPPGRPGANTGGQACPRFRANLAAGRSAVRRPALYRGPCHSKVRDVLDHAAAVQQVNGSSWQCWQSFTRSESRGGGLRPQAKDAGSRQPLQDPRGGRDRATAGPWPPDCERTHLPCLKPLSLWPSVVAAPRS